MLLEVRFLCKVLFCSFHCLCELFDLNHQNIDSYPRSIWNIFSPSALLPISLFAESSTSFIFFFFVFVVLPTFFNIKKNRNRNSNLVGFPCVPGQTYDYGWTLLNKPTGFNPRTCVGEPVTMLMSLPASILPSSICITGKQTANVWNSFCLFFFFFFFFLVDSFRSALKLFHKYSICHLCH